MSIYLILFFSNIVPYVAVVRVGFDSATYQFTEGDSGILVVQKSAPLDSSIKFRVFGAGLVDINDTFGAGVDALDTIMITLNTTDNNVALEPDLVFNVSLEIISPDPQIVLNISETTVTVVDNDSK